jgi:hypothetical protein
LQARALDAGYQGGRPDELTLLFIFTSRSAHFPDRREGGKVRALCRLRNHSHAPVPRLDPPRRLDEAVFLRAAEAHRVLAGRAPDGEPPAATRGARLVRFVARSDEGKRNNMTYWAACRAGEMVASGLLEADDAVAIIAEAATRAGLSPAEAERTAWSGIRSTGVPNRD